MESTCPKGHRSAEVDFCSECGAKIGGPATHTSGLTCPDCGSPRVGNFCEVCGRNFSTGARGEVRAAAAAPACSTGWSLTVSVDPALRGDGSPEAPAFAPVTIELNQPVNLIGRRSDARAIFPEISLDHDDAVSHRHALLQRGPDGILKLRDIGGANGTRLNGHDVPQLTDVPLKDSDRIERGHWTRLTVKAS